MLSALNDGDARSKSLLTRLADYPKSPAIIGVAEVLAEQGRYSEAVSRLRGVAEIYGDVYRFNLVLARACRDAGEAELAKEYYEKACKIAPQNEVAIKELIALTAFPHVVPKPSSRFTHSAMERKTAPALGEPAPKKSEPGASESETPSVFKLDREKLSKALGGVIGSAEKDNDTPTEIQKIEVQKSTSSTSVATSSVVEAFRKADNLLEQDPDLDALAREMMGGNAFLPQEEQPSASQRDVRDNFDKPPMSDDAPPKAAAPQQQGRESEADIDALARQMLGTDDARQSIESKSTARSESTIPTHTTEQLLIPSAPTAIHADENGNPVVKIDRNKLTQALSGIYKAKGIAPNAPHADEEDDMPFPMPTKIEASRAPEPPPIASHLESPSQSGGALSFEEEIMAMQMQGGDIDAFISNKDTSHRNEESAIKPPLAPPPLSNEYDIDALAREMMSAQLPKVVETNDPTPVAEQRQPFSDDDEIKMPTRQLAKIFQAQGAFGKAIKVYEMLARREPENASLYEILISELRNKTGS